MPSNHFTALQRRTPVKPCKAGPTNVPPTTPAESSCYSTYNVHWEIVYDHPIFGHQVMESTGIAYKKSPNTWENKPWPNPGPRFITLERNPVTGKVTLTLDLDWYGYHLWARWIDREHPCNDAQQVYYGEADTVLYDALGATADANFHQ